MATKKSPTSKTAHVLNIISGDAPAAESEEQVDRQPAPTTQAEPNQRRSVPPILEHAKTGDDLLADQIRAAMEEELRSAMEEAQPEVPAFAAAPTPAPIPDPEPIPQPIPAPVPIPEPVYKPEPGPVPEPASAVQPQVEVSPPTVATVRYAPPKDSPGDLVYINVMQALVDEKADRYIRMFGLCACERCAIDVKALALSSLPAKYVVMHRGEMVPMLTVYESRYSAAVIAQLIQACKIVMDSPRHTRG